jgi:tetratricopeptide (TPR) repeat protein
MSGFVVCQSCGTRIKAGRGHCLKCFAPLPDPDAPVPTPLSVSLGFSRNAEIGVWIGAALAALLLAAVIWQTWPVPADDLAQPAGVAATPLASSPAAGSPQGGVAQVQPLEPSSADASTGAGAASSDPGLESTRADVEQQLTDRPNDPVLLNRLGQVLERMGRADEAIVRFERAVVLAPLEPTYRLNLARTAGQLGQTDRAIDQYREAVRLRPTDYDALNALGLALQKKGDDKSAVAAFTKARRANPSGPAAALGMATSLEKAGRVDEAVEVFRQYLDIRPTPVDAEKVKAHLALLSRAGSQVK